MAIVDQISTFQNGAWSELYDIGANATNVIVSPSIGGQNNVQSALNYLNNNSALTTVLNSSLSPNKILISNSNGKLAASEVSSNIFNTITGDISSLTTATNTINDTLNSMIKIRKFVNLGYSGPSTAQNNWNQANYMGVTLLLSQTQLQKIADLQEDETLQPLGIANFNNSQGVPYVQVGLIGSFVQIDNFQYGGLGVIINTTSNNSSTTIAPGEIVVHYIFPVVKH